MPDLNITSGVTRHIRDLFSLFNDSSEYGLFLLTGGGDAVRSLSEMYPGKILLSKFPEKKSSPIKQLRFYNELKKHCIDKRINIIHSHHRYPELISSFLPAGLKIKTVHTVHSLLNDLKLLSFRSDRLIAVSNSVRQNLIGTYHIKPEKITTIYNFVYPDIEVQGEGQSPDREDKKFTVFYAGRFCYDKGTDVLIKAADIIADKRSDINFELVGEDYDNLFTDLYTKVYSNIKFFAPQANLSKFYSKADVIVIPSRRDPFPYIMLEAGIYKKPVIASAADGLKEFIVNDESGLTFNSGNAEELADKLCFAADNRDKLQALAENHHRKVLAECSPDRYLKSITGLYDAL